MGLEVWTGITYVKSLWQLGQNCSVKAEQLEDKVILSVVIIATKKTLS